MIVATILLVFQLHLLRADDSTSTTTPSSKSNSDSNSKSDEDYENEAINDIVSEVKTTIDHWRNCTVNGNTYYDDDCEEWMRDFYVAMSLTVAGVVLIVLATFWIVRRFCCSRGRDDFERLINDRH